MANDYPNWQSPIHNSSSLSPPSTSSASSLLHPDLEPSGSSRNNSEGRSFVSNVLREFQQRVESARTSNSQAITISNIFNTRPVNISAPSFTNNQLSDNVVINLDSSNRFGEVTVGEAPQSTNSPDSNNDIVDSEDQNTDNAHNVMEAQQSLQFVLKYSPFCIILLAKGIYDHGEGISNLIFLCAMFIQANSVVKKEATAQAGRSLYNLLRTLLFILACFVFIAYVFEDENLYLNLVFLPPYKQPSTVWELLWSTALSDFILKLFTIVLKIVLTMLPARIIPFKRRGKVYLLIEAVSQLYRSIATIQPWLYYLLESYEGLEKVVGMFLSSAYMVSKGSDLVSRFKLFISAVVKVLQNVSLGTTPSEDQLRTAGNHCPICHDSYDSPVLLQCRHIFCEGCVLTWFDREQTCPLCRAKIANDPAWRDGSTTFFMQLF